jgi:hypothetical protein
MGVMTGPSRLNSDETVVKRKCLDNGGICKGCQSVRVPHSLCFGTAHPS